MSTVLAADQSWRRVPAVLRKLDAHPVGKLEAWSTALLHNCVAYIPGVKRSVIEQLGLPFSDQLLWRRGGHGEGDITACTEADDAALAYIETKGATTRVSYGDGCPQRCGEYRSQFLHMSHGDLPLLVVAPQRNLASRERAWRSEHDLPAHAVVMSYSGMADLIEKALLVDDLPEYSLLDALYDVEKVVLTHQLDAGVRSNRAGVGGV